MKKALIEITTGKVVNVILAEADWAPPAGYTVKPADHTSVGDTWDGQKFIAAPPPLPDPKMEARRRLIDAILANKGSGPWGSILHDLAIAQGLIAPE